MKMGKIHTYIILFALVCGVLSVCADPKCSTCSADPKTCTACMTGFSIPPSAPQCVPCPMGCASCDNSDPPACLTCMDGSTVITATKKCLVCSPICAECMNTPDNCKSCPPGQFLARSSSGVGRTCIPQSSCPPGCLFCATKPGIAATNPPISKCIICRKGFVSDGLGSCKACPPTCNECVNDITGSTAAAVALSIIDKLQALKTAIESDPTSKPASLTNVDVTVAVSTNQISQDPITSYFYFIFGVPGPLFTRFIPKPVILDAISIATAADITPYTIPEWGFGIMVEWTKAQFQAMMEQQLDASKTTSSTGQKCTVCKLGFTAANFQCVGCSAGCKECTGQSACTACLPGFALISSACVKCEDPCLDCSAATTCLSCKPPLKLTTTGTCISCNAPCASCKSDNASFCLSCIPPFSSTASTTGECGRCTSALCKTCAITAPDTCTECIRGTVLANGICQICPERCNLCSVQTSGTIKCASCPEGTILFQEKCTPCPPGCKTCDTTDPRKCLTCQDGSFYETSTGQCKVCSNGCKSCSQTGCLEASNGFVMVNNKATLCRPGCLSCNPSSPENCLQCDKPFFKDSDKCKPCHTTCLTCTASAATACSSCREGVTLAAGACTQCDRACLTCDGTTKTACLTCRLGMILSSATCVPAFGLCPRGCLKCDPTTKKCTSCQPGTASTPDGRCVKCFSSCGGVCQYNDLSACISCAPGFELVSSKCVRCPKFCIACSEGSCTTCAPGFELTTSIDTTGKATCITKCNPPCEKCDQTGCSVCVSGFKLVGASCAPDITCSSTTTACTTCPPSTFLSTGNCINCVVGCGDCDTTTCNACADGFYLSSNQCVACGTKCRTCFAADACITCNAGFVMEVNNLAQTVAATTFSNNCVPCSPPCKTCFITPVLCLSCNDNFTLNGTKCRSDTKVGFRVVLSDNYADFMKKGNLSSFTDGLVGKMNVSDESVSIEKVQTGSTIIGGTISSADGSSASASSLAASFSSAVSSLGFTVISSEVAVFDKSETKVQNNTPGPNIPAIVGGVVGGIVLVVLIGVGIYLCKKKSSQALISAQGHSTEMKLQKY